MRYWLMKSEPGNYSIDDLKRDKKAPWTGVRNYQARNYMMNDMGPGDLAIFYHSNAEPSGAVGTMKISAKATPDRTQFEKKSMYFEKRATSEKPVWFCVEVEYVETFKSILSLEAIREVPKLSEMGLLKRGNRLSVQPLEKAEFGELCRLAKKLG